MIELNLAPSDRQLRQFAATGAIAIPLIGWLWLGNNLQILSIVISGSWLALGLGAVFPKALKYPFIGLSLIFLPVGLVVSEALLLIMFFLIVLPAGLFFRLTGKDSLNRERDENLESYWTDKESPKSVERYFKQY